MEWSLTQNKLLAFHRLMRTDKPIGALLLLWPTLWALWVATPGVPQLWILAVFVAGVWLMRAAGCVVNDYADRKFDGHVKRTANRPLPSGAVTEKEARTLFVVLVLISFLLVLTLNTMTILLSIAALALAAFQAQAVNVTVAYQTPPNRRKWLRPTTPLLKKAEQPWTGVSLTVEPASCGRWLRAMCKSATSVPAR